MPPSRGAGLRARSSRAAGPPHSGTDMQRVRLDGRVQDEIVGGDGDAMNDAWRARLDREIGRLVATDPAQAGRDSIEIPYRTRVCRVRRT